MSWSGGTFTRVDGTSGWADDEAGGIGIVSSNHDTADNDLATGINACLNKDGSNAATANLAMGGFVHANVGAATARTHYARMAEVQDSVPMYGGTSGGTANAQTITCVPAVTALVAGQIFRWKAGAALTNTGATTLQVNSTTATAVKDIRGNALVGGEILAGAVNEALFDGTNYILLTNSGGYATSSPTPGVGGGGSFSVGPTLHYCNYRRWNGLLVFFQAYFTGTTTGTVTSYTIAAPITSANLSQPQLIGAYADDGGTTSINVIAKIANSSTTITITKNDGTNFSAGAARGAMLSGWYMGV